MTQFNNNLKLITENKKPFEIVQEVNNETQGVVGDQIPSYEEFLKKYEADGSLNYDDLSGGGIGEVKGCGPYPDGCEQMSRTEIRDRNGNYVMTLYGAVRFFLKVDCLNWGGGGGYTRYLTSTSEALDYAHELERGKHPNVSSEVELKCAILIRDAIRYYENGNKVFGHIKVQGKFWGGYEWSYKF